MKFQKIYECLLHAFTSKSNENRTKKKEKNAKKNSQPKLGSGAAKGADLKREKKNILKGKKRRRKKTTTTTTKTN